MKKLGALLGLVAIALVVAAATALAASKNQTPTKIVVAMTAAQEVPACAPATDATRGNAVFRITDAAAGTVRYKIVAKRVPGDINAAHIHQAPAGMPGDIVQPLELKAGAKTGVIARGTFVNPDLVAALQDNPADYYVNVHSTVCGPGVIRGQFAEGSL